MKKPWVKSEEGTTLTMEEHLKKNNRLIVDAIQSGFEHAKELVRRDPTLFTQFIESIPNELPTRFVPCPTQNLITLLSINPPDKSPLRLLSDTLITKQAPDGYQAHHGFRNEEIGGAMMTDILHHSVPIMQTNLTGVVTYNGRFVWKAKEGMDIKALIIRKIESAGELTNALLNETLDDWRVPRERVT